MTRAGLAEHSLAAGKAVTKLLQRMARTGNPLGQDCLKLLASLMRQSQACKPSNAQLCFLLTWAFEDMEQAVASHAAFTLLKVLCTQNALSVPIGHCPAPAALDLTFGLCIRAVQQLLPVHGVMSPMSKDSTLDGMMGPAQQLRSQPALVPSALLQISTNLTENCID